MNEGDRCLWGIAWTATQKQHLGLSLQLGLSVLLKEALVLVADRLTP